MNEFETTFTITGAAVAIVGGLATLYYFKRTDEEVPYHQKSISKIGKQTKANSEEYQNILDDFDRRNRGTGKHKRDKKHKRSKKHKK